MSCACSAARPRPGRRGPRGSRAPAHRVAQGGRGPQPRQASRQAPGPRARTASESSRAQGLLQRRARAPRRGAHARAHTRGPQPAHASRWRRRRAGPGGPKTNKLRPGSAAAGPPPGARLPQAAGYLAAALPACRRRPGPAAGRRGVISGRAEGGDEPPRRQAWRCVARRPGAGRRVAGATASEARLRGRSRLKADPRPGVAGTAAALDSTREDAWPGPAAAGEETPSLEREADAHASSSPAGTPSPARPGTRGWNRGSARLPPSLRSSP